MGDIVKIPLTGTVKGFNIEKAKLDGIGVSGEPNDPVRPIDLKGINVEWKLISIDLENDEAIIELYPPEHTSYLIPGGNPNSPEGYRLRDFTAQEKQAEIDKAKAHLSKPKDELYAETGSKRLKKLQKHVDDYKKFKEKRA